MQKEHQVGEAIPDSAFLFQTSDFSLLYSTCYLFDMNPYASQLGNQDPIHVLSVTASRLDDLDFRQALDTFAALRRWNLALIQKLTPEQMAKGVMHPERGQETLLGLFEISAGHDINHLRQLEAVAAKPAA